MGLYLGYDSCLNGLWCIASDWMNLLLCCLKEHNEIYSSKNKYLYALK